MRWGRGYPGPRPLTHLTRRSSLEREGPVVLRGLDGERRVRMVWRFCTSIEGRVSMARNTAPGHYQPNDQFTVADFFDCLSFKSGELHLETDYVRGRSMKTVVTTRADGTVTLTTWGRGQSA